MSDSDLGDLFGNLFGSVSPPTDEEKELTKGMPPEVAKGFIAARRKEKK